MGLIMENNKEDKTLEPELSFLALGGLGLALFIISIILIIGGYYFTPHIETYFNTTILLPDKPRTHIFMRLYVGFLGSSIMTLTVQFILWLLVKGIILGQCEYYKYLDDVITVRNFSVIALAVLTAILKLFTGETYGTV